MRLSKKPLSFRQEEDLEAEIRAKEAEKDAEIREGTKEDSGVRIESQVVREKNGGDIDEAKSVGVSFAEQSEEIISKEEAFISHQESPPSPTCPPSPSLNTEGIPPLTSLRHTPGTEVATTAALEDRLQRLETLLIQLLARDPRLLDRPPSQH